MKPSFPGLIVGIVLFGVAACYWDLEGGFFPIVLAILGIIIVGFEVFLREKMEEIGSSSKDN